jgi:hypothetical protein
MPSHAIPTGGGRDVAPSLIDDFARRLFNSLVRNERRRYESMLLDLKRDHDDDTVDAVERRLDEMMGPRSR